jgi:hypothetical protein
MNKRVSSASVEPVFVWSDAWVLAAVAVGGGLKGCGLKEIIAAGELINRAIMSATEIRTALGKLIYKEYVGRADEDHFIIAGEARDAVEQIFKKSSASFSVMQFFEEFLDVDPYSLNRREMADLDCPLPGLSDERIRAAAQAYREEMAALWRELRQFDKQSLPERAMRLLEEASKLRS